MYKADELDLKMFIDRLVNRVPSIESVHLFGSRRHGTGSQRSDIDLLVLAPKGIDTKTAHWIRDEFEPIDVFLTFDMKNATSIANGSNLISANGLPESVSSVELWSNTDGFVSEDSLYNHEIAIGVDFTMTIIPRAYNPRRNQAELTNFLHDECIPNTSLGVDWEGVGERVCNVLERSMQISDAYEKRAKVFHRGVLQIETEYDFQNIIYTVLKPWIPDLVREPFTIRYAGTEKSADFASKGSKLVIEAKHMRKDNKNEIVKLLGGLTEIYQSNPGIMALLFIVAKDNNVDIDMAELEAKHSKVDGQRVVKTKFISVPSQSV